MCAEQSDKSSKHATHLCKSFFNEPWIRRPEVIGVDVFRLGIFACQHATDGTVAHNPNTKLSAHWHQIFLNSTSKLFDFLQKSKSCQQTFSLAALLCAACEVQQVDGLYKEYDS